MSVCDAHGRFFSFHHGTGDFSKEQDMYDEYSERERLDKGWLVILVVWGAMLGSLGVYLVICWFVHQQGGLRVAADMSLDTIKYALFGISFVELFVIHYVRKAALKVRGPVASSQSSSAQHPAVAKYMSAVLVAAALSESIGIYGVVLFFLSDDTMPLYQFVALSAMAMLYFRPRKEEFLNLVDEMERAGE